MPTGNHGSSKEKHGGWILKFYTGIKGLHPHTIFSLLLSSHREIRGRFEDPSENKWFRNRIKYRQLK
jgi:hypothetical protein